MSAPRKNSKKSRRNIWLYMVAGIFLIAAGTMLAVRNANATVHPKPRAEAAQLQTESPDDFTDAETRESYRMAAEVKEILDGLFCYCYCKGGGHYSLLDCFRDEHGAGCDICKGEARLAYKMAQEGKTLEQIRIAIDQQFGEQQ